MAGRLFEILWVNSQGERMVTVRYGRDLAPYLGSMSALPGCDLISVTVLPE